MLFGLIKEGNEQVLTVYKADVKDHKAGMKELEGAEKELAAVELEHMEARNKGMEESIRTLGQYTFALLAVKEVGEVVWDGYKEGLHEAKLATAAAGIDIEKLSAAAGGLQTHLQLLEFAAMASNSAFHNTAEDMEVAERAIRKLEARGVPAADAVDAITNAVVGAKVKGLIPLGIVVDSHLGKLAQMDEANMTSAQKTEVHARAMEELKKFTEGTNDAQENLGDSMAKAGVELQNSWAELKISLGELASAFTPLLDAIQAAIKGWALLAHTIAGGAPLSIESIQYQLTHGAVTNDNTQEKADPRKTAWASYSIDPKEEAKAHAEHVKFVNDEALRTAREAAAAARKLAEEELRLNEHIFENHIKELSKSMSMSTLVGPDGKLLTLEEFAKKQNENVQKAWDEHQGQERARMKEIIDRQNELGTRDERHDKFDRKQTETALTKIFGKPDEFKLYEDLWKGLESTVTSAYAALVNGSQSAGEVIKHAMASWLISEGTKLAIMSLEALGTAIGWSFTPGGQGIAAGYFQQSAIYAAGAVAAGVGANALGGTGGSGGSSSAPAMTGPAMSTNAPRSQTNVFVIGDAFADDSIRARQLKAQKYFGLATGVTGTENG